MLAVSPQRVLSGTGQPSTELMVTDELQNAIKAIPYSQFIQDFINSGDSYGQIYTEEQAEMVYRTSVYLFAAMRRLAFLFSQVRIIGEQKKGEEWERLPDTHPLNQMFDDLGGRFLFQLCMYYALYGSVLIYKRKTRRAVDALNRGRLITHYLQGAVSGLHVIPNAHWSMDEYDNEIRAFNLSERQDTMGDRRRLAREEVIFTHDFDPRYVNGAVSMASLAINDAVSNAAIARWASHYFMSGAMPLLLVTVEGHQGGGITQAEPDVSKWKGFVERAWRGMFGQYALRAVYTSRKLSAEKVGINAEDVEAPELDRKTLNAIASVFQIAPDLIVPPEGGSDNARHKYLILQAYTDAVEPLGDQILPDINRDLGFAGSDYRLVIITDHIQAYEADRGDRATTETSIWQAGVQSFGDTQDRLRIDPEERLRNFYMAGGTMKSVDRILREDKMVDYQLLQYIAQGWNDGWVRRSDIQEMAGIQVNQTDPDGYKYELIEETGMAIGGDEPPAPEGGPPSSGTPAPPPDQPDGGSPANEPPPKETDGDKQVEMKDGQNQTTLRIDAADEEGTDQGRSEPAPHPLWPSGSTVQDVPLPDEGPELSPVVIAHPDPLYAALMIGEDSLIKTAQEQLARLMARQETPVAWSDPDTWHVTLAYCLDCPDETLELVKQLLPASLGRISLRANKIQLFDTDDGTCINLGVELDDALLDAFEKVRKAFMAHQLPLSEFSFSENYNPHITLGYAPLETYVPELAISIVVEPKTLMLGRGDYVAVHEVPIYKDWRDLLGDYNEPDGTGQIYDVNALFHREQLAEDIDRTRQDWRSRLRHWFAAGGDPPAGLPENLVDDVIETEAGYPDAEVLDMAMEAIENGYYDAHTVRGGNPVLLMLEKREEKAMQPDAKSELQAWERFALQNGAKKAGARFETYRLPLEVVKFVKDTLPETQGKPAIRALFAKADALLADLTYTPESDEDALAGWAERMQETGLDDLVDLPPEDEL